MYRDRFPGYRLLRCIRRGPNADVVDAFSDDRGARCIIKLLRRGADRDDARDLAREGQLLLALTHPHIVRAYEVLRRPRLAVVLETLPGETLGHLLAHRESALPASDIARLGLQLASALGYLHGLGVVHLDVKPSNVICHGGIVKLIDVGLARRAGRVDGGSGTPGYCSPEQDRGGVVGPASDVFALGVVLREAAADARRGARPARVSALRRLPPAMAAALEACTDADPASRPRLDELRSILEDVRGRDRKRGTYSRTP